MPEKPTFNPEQAPKEELGYKQKYRDLTKIMHPDTGGDHELMVRLNKAYAAALKGDTKLLDAMYAEWTGAQATKESPKPLSPEMQAKITEIDNSMQELSHQMFENARSGKRQYYPNYLKLQSLYANLYYEHGLEPDMPHIMDVLYEQGWLQDDEYLLYLEKKEKKK